MRAIIIIIFLVVTAFGFLLKYLDFTKRNAPIPNNVKDVYDTETYKKYLSYSMDKTKFSIISGIVFMVLTLIYLLGNFHNGLYNFMTFHTDSIYWKSLYLFLVPMVILTAVRTLLGIYDTFVVEAKYGFNKTTPATYIADFCKRLLIMIVVVGGLLSLFLLLHGAMGDWVFLVFFFIMAAFNLFVGFIYPLLFRLFFKLTPLEDGELKNKVVALAEKTGIQIKGVYSVNASKRTTRPDAFCAGFGKTKTIGLFDNLIEKMTVDEVIFVLAHEIEHEKKKHILKSLPLDFLSLAVTAVLAYFIVTLPETSMAFGFAGTNIAFGVYICFILKSPIDRILDIPANALSRTFEYEADNFGKSRAGKKSAISAMKKLYRENMVNLTPHPFVVMMEHTHPTASQRIAAFEKGK